MSSNNVPANNDPSLRQWWGAYKGRALKALAIALGISREELYRRLGVTSATHIDPISLIEPPKLKREKVERQKRPRGRPRRDVDRNAMVTALQRTGGKVREAARLLDVPKSTFARQAATVEEWAYAYGPNLREYHARLLHESWVSPQVAMARGYVSGPKGMEIPIWSVHRQIEWWQTRVDPSHRLTKHGKPSRRDRYRNQRGAFPVVDVSPWGRSWVFDESYPLFVAESPRKADAAVSRGMACVALQGCGMLCLDEEIWNYLVVKNRGVVLCFDSDVATNPQVLAAETKLAKLLTRLGATVSVVRLPGYKTGLDDWLARGHDDEELLSLSRIWDGK